MFLLTAVVFEALRLQILLSWPRIVFVLHLAMIIYFMPVR